MPQFDDNHVRINGGVIVWDGITQPEQITVGTKAGGLKWTLKAVFPPNCPDLQLFHQLAEKKLRESQFKGVLPHGGRMPIAPVQPGEFGDMFPGWYVISFKTTLKAPDVYDENGAPLDPMRYGPLVYPGQRVDVLAHCYEYNNAGNKGISGGLDAFAIIASANAPRLNIGGGINTAGAFAGSQQPPAQGGYQQPPAQGGYQQPAAQGGAPAHQPQPNYGGAPQQAHDFLPRG